MANVKSLPRRAWERWLENLPTIVFFIFHLYFLRIFFSWQFVFVTFTFVSLFNFYRQMKFSARLMGSMLLRQLVLGVLAFFATLNIPLSVLLNIAVPFVLVVFRSNRVRPTGYLLDGITFLFLQLLPVGWAGFPRLFLLEVITAAFCFLFLFLYSVFLYKEPLMDRTIYNGFGLLAAQFANLAEGRCDVELVGQIHSVQKLLFQQIPTSPNQWRATFAILFQRTTHFGDMCAEKPQLRAAGQNASALLMRVSHMLKRAEEQFSPQGNASLLEEVQALLAGMPEESDELLEFVRSFLRLFALALQETAPGGAAPAAGPARLTPASIVARLKECMNLQSFEFRTGVKLAVLFVGVFLFVRFDVAPRAYYFPLNAYLMIGARMEDGDRMAKNRFIGTLIGCAIGFFLVPPIAGLGSIATQVFLLLMVNIMQCFPGFTWEKTIFTTLFGLFLTAASLPNTEAILLRLFYICISMVAVFLVSRLVLPCSPKWRLRSSVEAMMAIQRKGLDILENCAGLHTDYQAVSRQLVQYNLLSNEALACLEMLKDEGDKQKHAQMLETTRRMMSEMEQIVFCLCMMQAESGDDKMPEDLRNTLNSVARGIREGDRQNMAVPADVAEKEPFCRLVNQPYLNMLLEQYAQDSTLLYGEEVPAGRAAC